MKITQIRDEDHFLLEFKPEDLDSKGIRDLFQLFNVIGKFAEGKRAHTTAHYHWFECAIWGNDSGGLEENPSAVIEFRH